MASEAMRVGIIGTGNIAPAYLQGCGVFPQDIQVVACADIDVSKAQTFAQAHNLRALSVDDLLADDTIDIVINLTIPAVHADVDLRVIAAGKHVYSEKPLAIASVDGEKILEAAKQAGVRVGCAPDTFLGGGGQTARHLIDAGKIGQPVAAVAFMVSRGPESWHPNPFFFYQQGGGPMFDMGPYYITTLVNLMGPVARVTGASRASFPERVAGHEGVRGQKIPVETTTHLTGTLDFVSGAVATLIMSFDVWAHHLPRIEIYGSDGSLNVPDPNTFGGSVTLWTPDNGAWTDVPLTHPADGLQRGIGVADMARAIRDGRPHRASGAIAQHVLEVMSAFDQASQSGQHITVQSRPAQPEPLSVDFVTT